MLVIYMNPVVKTMKYLISISVFFILFSCTPKNSKTEVIEEFNADGTIKSSTPVSNGLRNGLVKHYNEHGRLISSVEYKDDKREGLYEEFFPQNGKLVLKVIFKNDIQEGPLQQFYQEGMLYRESFYINGRVNGPYTTYWPNGKKREIVYFNMGKRLIKSEEFDKEGNQVKNFPEIIIKQTDRIKSANKYIVEFSLSKPIKNPVFYTAKPDSIYLPAHMSEITLVNGKPARVFYLLNGQTVKTNILVIVKYKSDFNNYIYLSKPLNINISH